MARNFYWLNVVRFFAGCFSKGELLDLADRVKALIQDALVGKTRQPIVLAAMLLSDWVFEQSPKAVSQLVDLLSSPDSMQRMLAPTRYGKQDVVTLPAQSGGRKVFEAAFALLESPTTHPDRLRAFATVAAAQFPADICQARWLESAAYTGNPSRWLEIGRYLNSLPTVDVDVLRDKLSNASLNRAMATVLVLAGRSDCALSSEHNVQLLFNVLLSEPRFVLRRPITAPFYLLGSIVGSKPYSFRFIAGFDEMVSSFREKGPSETERHLHTSYPFIKQAYELSLEFSRLYSEADTVVQQLAAFEKTLEMCRITWGSRPAIISSLIECSIQRRIRPSIAPFDFFAPQLTATQRLRAAKARRTNFDWWLHSLENYKNQSKSLRLLLLESLFLLCPTSLVLQCESQLAGILDGLPEEEWATLVQMLSMLSSMVTRQPNKEESTTPAEPKLNSMRFSYLIAVKEPDRFAQSVFLTYFRTYSAEAFIYLEFRQEHALRCAIAGSLQWNEALEIVKDGYARGIHATDTDYQLVDLALAIPPDVYSQVLSNSQIYPIALCDAAEAAASRAARKAVKTVSSVAKAERWFAFDT